MIDIYPLFFRYIIYYSYKKAYKNITSENFLKEKTFEIESKLLDRNLLTIVALDIKIRIINYILFRNKYKIYRPKIYF